MRIFIFNKNKLVEVYESNKMFRADGSFFSCFRAIFKRAVEKGHDVVFSPDNKVNKISIERK